MREKKVLMKECIGNVYRKLYRKVCCCLMINLSYMMYNLYVVTDL